VAENRIYKIVQSKGPVSVVSSADAVVDSLLALEPKDNLSIKENNEKSSRGEMSFPQEAVNLIPEQSSRGEMSFPQEAFNLIPEQSSRGEMSFPQEAFNLIPEQSSRGEMSFPQEAFNLIPEQSSRGEMSFPQEAFNLIPEQSSRGEMSFPLEEVKLSDYIKKELIMELALIKGFECQEQPVRRLGSIMLDSGATASYIATKDYGMVSWSARSSGGYVKVANGDAMALGQSGTIRLAVSERTATRYPRLAIKCIQVHGLDESVIGVGSILDALPQASVNFTGSKVEVFDNNILLMEGKRNLMSGLWQLDICEAETTSTIMSMRAMLPHVHLESMRDKVAYLHAVMGFCPLSTLKVAIENKWVEVMGITG